ncbi:hypothetical protein HYPSUDRAFT_49801 [Hypholoma sublateritium FD-334 SS-4]|uniref:Uncharacterized protein n=1 Tax=Hypholoma sublateritium (strain FD-334 SS-4) TaxID=945553 RepID=A0A0D2NA70_HYPSF|nr:hypothetical protein HYPSUDRAFT_49801 [Hypholoma sublateritium FD-334 SS-4]
MSDADICIEICGLFSACFSINNGCCCCRSSEKDGVNAQGNKEGGQSAQVSNAQPTPTVQMSLVNPDQPEIIAGTRPGTTSAAGL